MSKNIKQKAFVNHQFKALFFCHACSQSKFHDVSQYKDVGKVVTVSHECQCGNRYEVELEWRKMVRKPSRIAGAFSVGHLPGKIIESRMTVKDISMAGLGLRMQAGHGLKIGDSIDVQFRLDDDARSSVFETVVVRNIKGRVLGTEFEAGIIIDRAIGRYLVRQ